MQSHLNYAGETPGLPVSKHQKLRTFARENDALLVYCLTCVFALFLPYTGALVVSRPQLLPLCWFFRRGATLALLCGVLVSCAHFYRYEDTQIPSGCFDTPIQVEVSSFPFLNVARVWETLHYLSFDFEIRESIPHECGSRTKVRAYAHYKDVAPALKIGDLIAGEIGLRPTGSLWNRGHLPSNIHALRIKRQRLRVSVKLDG